MMNLRNSNTSPRSVIGTFLKVSPGVLTGIALALSAHADEITLFNETTTAAVRSRTGKVADRKMPHYIQINSAAVSSTAAT